MSVHYVHIDGRWYTEHEISLARCMSTLQRLCGETSPLYRTFCTYASQPRYDPAQCLLSLVWEYTLSMAEEKVKRCYAARDNLASSPIAGCTTLEGYTAGVKVVHWLIHDRISRGNLPGFKSSWPTLVGLSDGLQNALTADEMEWTRVTRGKTHGEYHPLIWNMVCSRLQATVVGAKETGLIIGSIDVPEGAWAVRQTMEELRQLVRVTPVPAAASSPLSTRSAVYSVTECASTPLNSVSPIALQHSLSPSCTRTTEPHPDDLEARETWFDDVLSRGST